MISVLRNETAELAEDGNRLCDDMESLLNELLESETKDYQKKENDLIHNTNIDQLQNLDFQKNDLNNLNSLNKIMISDCKSESQKIYKESEPQIINESSELIEQSELKNNQIEKISGIKNEGSKNVIEP